MTAKPLASYYLLFFLLFFPELGVKKLSIFFLKSKKLALMNDLILFRLFSL